MAVPVGVAVRRLHGLVAATHPLPAAAVTAFAVAYALGVGLGARALAVGVAVLAGQLSIGWSNDWIDAGRDVAVGRADKPVVAGEVTAPLLRTAALAALVVAVPLSLALGVRAGLAHLVVVAGGWAYNAGLKATVWSWLPYAVAFGTLPSVATVALPGGSPAPAATTAAAALLGVGAHLANVLPDLDDDAATGVRGLPHRLGRRRALLATVALLLAAVLLVALAPAGAPGPLALAGLVGAAALTAWCVLEAVRRPGGRRPFTAAMAVAGIAVVLLVAGG